MPTSRRCRITATSPIRHPTAPSRTAPPAQFLWPTGFLCGHSVGLEFPAGQLAESDYWREQFQTISEDVSVRNVHWCIQRIRGFTTMRYINRLFTYLPLPPFLSTMFLYPPLPLSLQLAHWLTAPLKLRPYGAIQIWLLLLLLLLFSFFCTNQNVVIKANLAFEFSRETQVPLLPPPACGRPCSSIP